MAAILQNGGYIEILRGSDIFLKEDPYRVCVPNLELVS